MITAFTFLAAAVAVVAGVEVQRLKYAMSAERRHGSVPFFPIPKEPVVAATMTMNGREGTCVTEDMTNNRPVSSSKSLVLELVLKAMSCVDRMLACHGHPRYLKFVLNTVEGFLYKGVYNSRFCLSG